MADMSPSSRRAWIEIRMRSLASSAFASPSSRRAWIEIVAALSCCRDVPVALLAEGVDRNRFGQTERSATARSPSSRRAWIEIQSLS